jgi:hypothetical protein
MGVRFWALSSIYVSTFVCAYVRVYVCMNICTCIYVHT